MKPPGHQETPDVTRIKPDVLVEFATAALQTYDVPETDARLVADSLVQADLWGHQSHPCRPHPR